MIINENIKYREISNKALSLFNVYTFNKFMANRSYYDSLEYAEDTLLFSIGTYNQESAVDIFLLRLREEIHKKVHE